MIGLAEANAFVLQRQPYREQSWLLRLLTAHEGQLHVISRSAEGVHLYQPYHVELKGRAQGWSLQDMFLAGKVLRIHGSGSYVALYLNELCARLLPHEVPMPQLFGSYFAVLKALTLDVSVGPQLRFFESQLLLELGVGINTEFAADHLPIAASACYRFNVTSGFALAVHGPYRGEWIAALARHEYGQHEVMKMATEVYRQALQAQLAGRPLHSLPLLTMAGLYS